LSSILRYAWAVKKQYALIHTAASHDYYYSDVILIW